MMADDEYKMTTSQPGSGYYRPCVGAALFNNQGMVWVGKRISEPFSDFEFAWQMPQGGIDDGEDPSAAVVRELLEETGSNNSKILRESKTWHKYDLPNHMQRKSDKVTFRGQSQKWFALQYRGNDSDFNLNLHKKPEFSTWKWVSLTEVPELIVPFKRDVYKKVVEEFKDLPERIARV